MEHISYNTSGTCARKIEIDVENGIVVDVKFIGAAQAILKGLPHLSKGCQLRRQSRDLTVSVADSNLHPAPISSHRHSRGLLSKY